MKARVSKQNNVSSLKPQVHRNYQIIDGMEFVKSDIKLSISIMVSNRIESIRECMESIKPILDAVPSELIIVDTVGEENSDGSLAVAKEYATKVVHFDWCNDFAKARNAGLAHCRGEWFMFIDDDEYLSDAKEYIVFFNNSICDKYNSASLIVRSFLDNDRMADGQVNRICRVNKNTAFEGAIHEQLRPWFLPTYNFDAVVFHTGYDKDNNQEASKKADRNLDLLLQKYKQNPHDAALLNQIADSYYLKKDNKKAFGFLQKGYELGENSDRVDYGNALKSYFSVEIVEHISVKDHDFAKVIKQGEEYLGSIEFYLPDEIYMLCLIASAYFNLKDDINTVKYALKYFKKIEYYWKNKDKIISQRKFFLNLSGMLPKSQNTCLMFLLFSAKQTNQIDKYVSAVEKYTWENIYLFDSDTRNMILLENLRLLLLVKENEKVKNILTRIKNDKYKNLLKESLDYVLSRVEDEVRLSLNEILIELK